jgi:penicillin-binding protein 1C
MAAIRRGWKWLFVLPAVLLLWCLIPCGKLFDKPYSTVILDRQGQLLGAKVASDGQWRMQPSGPLPEKLERCLLEFEDRHFHDHWGIHVPSLVRAWQQNRRTGRVVSGGSTITMQLARMSDGNTERTYWRKLFEMLQAVRIELHFSKAEILSMYAANAPFGANVVGSEAAAWRWFGRSPQQLGWAENALLAVLPNAPSRIHPSKGRQALKAKRDRLLKRLLDNGTIDGMEYSLAIEEPLPERPIDLPRNAPHLLTTLAKGKAYGSTSVTTIDGALQDRITTLADRYAPILKANEVHNAAVLVLDVNSGAVLAYVGNLGSAGKGHAPEVDIVQASRSTGSLLKPFLYADMLQAGELMPDQLVADLPTHYDGFSPKNFEQRYDGAVPASQALARSLNIPAVRALRSHGIDRTLKILRAMGLERIDRSADHYGLSLMVGGAESSLWELISAYASIARIVLQYNSGSTQMIDPVHAAYLIVNDGSRSSDRQAPPISAAAAYHTLQALQQLNRPGSEEGWQHFGSEKIAWKTGTSFGHRDAWSIGVTDRYAVGVWTGNASGEGRPGLTGTLAAAPLMFEIFGILPDGAGFDPPYDEMKKIEVCRHSGYRASNDCELVDTIWTISTAIRTAPCPYHRTITVDADHRFRTRPSSNSVSIPWFVLPPAMEHYYMRSHQAYRPLPPFETTAGPADDVVMEMIYPEAGSHIHIPVQLDGKHGSVVFQAAHRDPSARVHWDLDGRFIGTTTAPHDLPFDPPAGAHRLTLTDHDGHTVSTRFQVERSATTALR